MFHTSQTYFTVAHGMLYIFVSEWHCGRCCRNTQLQQRGKKARQDTAADIAECSAYLDTDIQGMFSAVLTADPGDFSGNQSFFYSSFLTTRSIKLTSPITLWLNCPVHVLPAPVALCGARGTQHGRSLTESHLWKSQRFLLCSSNSCTFVTCWYFC